MTSKKKDNLQKKFKNEDNLNIESKMKTTSKKRKRI